MLGMIPSTIRILYDTGRPLNPQGGFKIHTIALPDYADSDIVKHYVQTPRI